ncbi:MAG: hypothetical protein KY446_07110 [Proteobacteria bacterium]|nr:hypothetical protein [Pseudomonadota bacterium]
MAVRSDPTSDKETRLAMILHEQTADAKASRFKRLIGRELAGHGGSRHLDQGGT